MQDFAEKFRIIILDQWQQWKLQIINGVLLLLFVVVFVYQSYEIVTLLKSQSTNTQLSKKYAASNQLAKVQSLADWHLFGVPPTPAAVVMPQTKWNLLGVILGANEYSNFAVIASNDSDEGIYQMGDKLPDGALVAKILPNQVLLTRSDNTNETLLISWDVSSPDSSQAGQPTPQSQQNAAPFAGDVPPINRKEPQ